MTEISAEYIRMLHPLDLEPADIADHIDAQDAKIKALVEALEHYACDCGDMCEQLNGTCGGTAIAALAAAKETT